MKPYYYVYQYDGYFPKARYETLESAQKESERLAKLNPGQSFEILMCLGISRATTAQTFWNDDIYPTITES